MEKWKYWLGAGLLALGYAFWPGETPKVPEPVKVEKPVKVKRAKRVKRVKIDLEKRIAEILTQQPEEIIVKTPEPIEEQPDLSNLPPCLRCPDWKKKVKPVYHPNDILAARITTNCGVLHGEQPYFDDTGRLDRLENYFCGRKEGRFPKWDGKGNILKEDYFSDGKFQKSFGFEEGRRVKRGHYGDNNFIEKAITYAWDKIVSFFEYVKDGKVKEWEAELFEWIDSF